jgi:hypothetical protein
VLRFHLLTDAVAAAVWCGIGKSAGEHRSAAGGEDEEDAAGDMFPLVLSPREQQLVTKCLREDVLMLGRGGTGKTTVTVHAMAAAAEEDPGARVLFLTVNRNLCSSVWRQVASLRRGTELASGTAAAAAAARAALPQTEEGPGPPAPAAMCDTGDAAWWPMFMSSRAWLLALDASLEEPFLCHESHHADAAFVAAILGTSGAATLDASPTTAADDDDPTGVRKAAGLGGRVFAGFDFWKRVYGTRKGLAAGALWTEFCTHIKGSRGALAAVRN